MNGKIGVLLELNCESDFVAKTDQFAELIKDLCMHVAASSPRWIASTDVPEDIVSKEKEIYMDQAKQAGKPEKMLEKIAEGKLKKFYSDVCLLEQGFVKEPDKSVGDLIKEKIGQTGRKYHGRAFRQVPVRCERVTYGREQRIPPSAREDFRGSHGRGTRLRLRTGKNLMDSGTDRGCSKSRS